MKFLVEFFGQMELHYTSPWKWIGLILSFEIPTGGSLDNNKDGAKLIVF